MSSLSTRAIAEEQMDAADLPASVYAEVLGDLAQVNRWTLAARPMIGFLDRIARRGDRLKILDVGFGAGDMLRQIAAWSAQRGVATQLVGIDLNPRSAEVARVQTPATMVVDYRTGDYAALAGEGWDVVLSSLVVHHMTHAQLIAFLRFMEREARRGWLVNDLNRHGFAHRGFPLLARVMGWHRIVREDGTLSIARAYRPDEWPPMLREAGVEGARVFRVFPFRLCVEKCR